MFKLNFVYKVSKFYTTGSTDVHDSYKNSMWLMFKDWYMHVYVYIYGMAQKSLTF